MKFCKPLWGVVISEHFVIHLKKVDNIKVLTLLAVGCEGCREVESTINVFSLFSL